MADSFTSSEPESPGGRDDVSIKNEKSPTPTKKSGKRGRKPSKIDVRAKLERSRQSARECRARKKLRYQYLEELVASRERAIHSLRDELDVVKQYCSDVDKGNVSDEVLKYVAAEKEKMTRRRRTDSEGTSTDGDEK